MPHFYVRPDSIRDRHFTIGGSEAHHIARVLRKRPGDVLSLFDGRSHRFEGRIDSVTSEAVSGVILEKTIGHRLPLPVILCQALPKGNKLEWILEKATELGVSGIVPVESERCIARIPREKAGAKLARWQKIVEAAAKQCGQSILPKVHPVRPFREGLEPMDRTSTLALFVWEGESQRTIPQAWEARPSSVKSIQIWIGPEGGFSTSEATLAKKRGAIPVTLGPFVLRSETAAIAALTLVLSELGVMG